MTPMSAMSMMPMASGMPSGQGGMSMMPMMMPMPMGMGMPMPMGGGMMPMGGGMPMGQMMGGMMPGMQMPQGMGMGGMPMMPMMMAMPMMCRMTCEMTKDGMVCKLAPMDASGMEMMTERCNAMSAMMAMGMPVMMSCGGMPMMIGTAAGSR